MTNILNLICAKNCTKREFYSKYIRMSSKLVSRFCETYIISVITDVTTCNYVEMADVEVIHMHKLDRNFSNSQYF